MKLKRMIECEIRLLFDRPRYLVLPCVLTLCLGLFTWISSDGIGIVWRLTKHPPFAPPLWLMFIMWAFVYSLFGIIISCSMICGLKCSLSLSTVVSYFAALFWCPIMLTAGAGFCAVGSLCLSAAYLLRVTKVIYRYSLLTAVSGVLIVIFETYMVCFSVGCVLLN